MGFMYMDIYYLILVVPAMILALFAQVKVKSTYKKFSQVRNVRGITGAQAAQQVLQLGLDGIGRVALAMPAAVAGAVIGQREPEIALHGQLRENSASSRPGFCFSV